MSDGELCHPGPTGRGGRPYHVLGVDGPGDPDDADYRLCAQCGFPCKLSRDTHGDSADSPGLSVTEVTVTLTDGSAVTAHEASVVAGCPFCGSLNYEGNNQMRNTPASSLMTCVEGSRSYVRFPSDMPRQLSARGRC